MRFIDARRLTGPSLLFDEPAAVLDVECTPDEADRLAALWETEVERLHDALGWDAGDTARRDLAGGVSLAFTAPIDALYAATEINERAFASCAAILEGGEPPDIAAALAAVEAVHADEANPALRDLHAAAAANGVSFLWDDDTVSLGLGRGSKTWPARRLPDAQTLDWSEYSDVPTGIVTGTNGKTTTVRLARHILAGSGLNVGMSSTDWIAVNDRILDRGDWSGPGGSRAVLRQADVDVAVLESARGGLLRRGLGVERANAALITNIAEDHLGDFGSRTLDELLDIKWIVSRTVQESGRLILNADDPRLVAKSAGFGGALVWFGLDARNETLSAHAAAGGLAFALDGHELVMFEDGNRRPICRDSHIPIALGGAARHNVANALAATALCWCLGASIADLENGLVSMSQDENPGRCNVYEVAGRRVLVDFAHNPHAMQALFDMAEALPAARRVLCFGQAGDRPDSLIRQMTRDAWAIGLDRVMVSELAIYHRGRQAGEVYAVIRDELLALGAAEEQIEHHEEELETLEAAFSWSEPGDLVIMLALGGAAPVVKALKSLGETRG